MPWKRLKNKVAIQDVEDRTEERVRRREAKRQEARETITIEAAKFICESVSDEPVDEDWVAQFYASCEDISNEQMRLLWSRILAGEVTNPGSFSLRTLAFVKTLSKLDADLFTRFCSMIWMTGSSPTGLRPITLNMEKLESVPGIEFQFDEYARLDTLGLIRFEVFSDFMLKTKISLPADGATVPDKMRLTWHYYGRPHFLTRPYVGESDPSMSFIVGKALLTDVGRELTSISGSTANEAYRQLMVSEFVQSGWDVDYS